MSKVDIISGFLGAGKTTLIKKLIKESLNNEKIVLIENEFGEIGIDGTFLKDAGIQITEMNSGCICCSLVGDFSEALKKVICEYHPDRILIEPSGVGKLSDVIQAVINIEDEDLQLNSFVTVIDAKKCKVYSNNFGEFFNNQIEYASTIILSRTQDIDKEETKACIDIIRTFNKKANIVTTTWEELSGETLMSAIENKDLLDDGLESYHHQDEHSCECGHHDHDECQCGHDHHHHHHADDVFTSIGKETVNTYTHEQLEGILSQLAHSEDLGSILRTKGILQSPDKSWLHFDLVPGEFEIRAGVADYTGRLCVIGSQLNEKKILELFGVE